MTRKPRASSGPVGSSAGIAIDAAGDIAYDPSANVLSLVAAAITRQDDLRIETNKRTDAELRHLREMATLRSRNAKEIRRLESDRLDKIRQVDVLAGNTAADRALVAIQTLAQSTASAAETLRAMVDNTAKSIAAQTESSMKGVNERLVMLERSLYEGKGKQALSDPMMEKLVQRMESLLESRASVAGKSAGASSNWALIGSVLAVIVLLISIGTFVFITLRKPAEPQIIYVPAPSAVVAPPVIATPERK